MLLGLDDLSQLVDDPTVRLVENLGERELTRPEGAGYDLRLRAAYRLTSEAGYLGISERSTPKATEIEPHYPASGTATIELLPAEFVLLGTIETVNMPEGLVGILFPRSTLFRSGISLHYSQINPGYSGTLTLGAHNFGSAPFSIEVAARFLHFMVVEVSGRTSQYRGQWQGGRVWTSREAQT